MPDNTKLRCSISFYGNKGLIPQLWEEYLNSVGRGKDATILIRSAICVYVRTGKFMCVGKIYVTDEMKNRECKKTIKSLYINNQPDIIEYFSLLKQNGIGRSIAVCEILNNSIQLVDSLDEVWIPDILDVNIKSAPLDISYSALKRAANSKENLSKKIDVEKQFREEKVETDNSYRINPAKNTVPDTMKKDSKSQKNDTKTSRFVDATMVKIQH